jgi:hypothetical protein
MDRRRQGPPIRAEIGRAGFGREFDEPIALANGPRCPLATISKARFLPACACLSVTDRLALSRPQPRLSTGTLLTAKNCGRHPDPLPTCCIFGRCFCWRSRWQSHALARIFTGWRQSFNAIAASSTDAPKRSSWCRIRVTRSARSAELR